jgi:phosphoribosylaminoimidazolecarboxamide formyltransferase/IMP cyclohydrolase
VTGVQTCALPIYLAKDLVRYEVTLLSTGGTAKAIREADLPVTDVAEVTGFPEMLDGRLKTLHPKVHGAILARRDVPAHLEQIAAVGIVPIDLVVVNLYRFEEAVSRQDCTLAQAIEQIDIGGPTMIRAAAKNWESVAVVVDPADYRFVLNELKATGGSISRPTRWRLAKKAFAVTAAYDAAINRNLHRWDGEVQ